MTTEKRYHNEECFYCKTIKKDLTMWCEVTLLCDNCSEEMLTPTAHYERTGKKSKKSMWRK